MTRLPVNRGKGARILGCLLAMITCGRPQYGQYTAYSGISLPQFLQRIVGRGKTYRNLGFLPTTRPFLDKYAASNPIANPSMSIVRMIRYTKGLMGGPGGGPGICSATSTEWVMPPPVPITVMV